MKEQESSHEQQATLPEPKYCGRCGQPMVTDNLGNSGCIMCVRIPTLRRYRGGKITDYDSETL